MIYLRIISMILPLPFAYFLFKAHAHKLFPWFIGVVFLAIASVIGMSWITSLVDHSPVWPQNLFEWREVLEYSASIAFSFLTGMLLGGVAWYLASNDSPHMSVLPFAVMAVSATISYERAKAESLGLQAKGGLMERAERIILLCLGLLFDNLLVPILWIMLVLTAITAVQRFVKVWKQAAVAPATEVKIEERLARRETKHAVRQERRHSNRRSTSR
jgi:hypothetical protein